MLRRALAAQLLNLYLVTVILYYLELAFRQGQGLLTHSYPNTSLLLSKLPFLERPLMRLRREVHARFSEASGAEKQVDFLPPLSRKRRHFPTGASLGLYPPEKGFPLSSKASREPLKGFEHASVIMKMLFITCYHGSNLSCGAGRECRTLGHSCMSWKLCGQNQGLHRTEYPLKMEVGGTERGVGWKGERGCTHRIKSLRSL